LEDLGALPPFLHHAVTNTIQTRHFNPKKEVYFPADKRLFGDPEKSLWQKWLLSITQR
jgi:hypothetical protein